VPIGKRAVSGAHGSLEVLRAPHTSACAQPYPSTPPRLRPGEGRPAQPPARHDAATWPGTEGQLEGRRPRPGPRQHREGPPGSAVVDSWPPTMAADHASRPGGQPRVYYCYSAETQDSGGASDGTQGPRREAAEADSEVPPLAAPSESRDSTHRASTWECQKATCRVNEDHWQ
jgi:hypothetical protein